MERIQQEIMEKSKKFIFVGNIQQHVTEEQLKNLFSIVGEVVSFKIDIDRQTGRQKTFGFCEYKDQAAAVEAARCLHNYEVGGKKLCVANICMERIPKTMEHIKLEDLDNDQSEQKYVRNKPTTFLNPKERFEYEKKIFAPNCPNGYNFERSSRPMYSMSQKIAQLSMSQRYSQGDKPELVIPAYQPVNRSVPSPVPMPPLRRPHMPAMASQDPNKYSEVRSFNNSSTSDPRTDRNNAAGFKDMRRILPSKFPDPMMNNTNYAEIEAFVRNPRVNLNTHGGAPSMIFSPPSQSARIPAQQVPLTFQRVSETFRPAGAFQPVSVPFRTVTRTYQPVIGPLKTIPPSLPAVIPPQSLDIHVETDQSRNNFVEIHAAHRRMVAVMILETLQMSNDQFALMPEESRKSILTKIYKIVLS